MSSSEGLHRRAPDGRPTPASPAAAFAVIGACAVVGALVLRALRTRRTRGSRRFVAAMPSLSGSERYDATAGCATCTTSDEALAERNDRYAG